MRDTFLEIWENGTGQRSVELMLEITGNIARTFGNIASSIKIAWDNELRSCPIPAQPVYGSQPIFTCPNNNNNGCGCGSF